MDRRLCGWPAWVFLGALLFCSLAAWYGVERFPPYLDYDAATDATFFNNLSFHKDYAYFYRDQLDFQNKMRGWYAAHRLPFSLPVSWLQQQLMVAPPYTDLFCKWLGIVLGLLGCCAAAAPLWLAAEPAEPRGALFVAALTAVVPPFFLYLRSGFPIWMACFTLFWLTVSGCAAYLFKQRALYLYLAALSAAYFAVNPYTHLIALPPALLLLFLLYRPGWRLALTPAPYLALLLALVCAAGLHLLCSLWFEGSLSAYWEKVQKFRAVRPVVSAAWQQIWSLLPEKLAKLYHSHLLFTHDTLGDKTRPDDLWELGRVHYPWLAAAILAAPGLMAGLWRRERTALVYASVLAGVWLVFLTVSYPESRYTIVAVPAYAFFAYRGVQLLDGRKLQTAVCAVLLAAVGGYTFLTCLVPGDHPFRDRFPAVGSYDHYMLATRHRLDGIKESVRAAFRLKRRPAAISLAVPHSYPSWLYYQMLANFELEWLEEPELLERAARGQGGPWAVVRPAGAEAGDLIQAGFIRRRRLVSLETNRQYALYVKKSRR